MAAELIGDKDAVCVEHGPQRVLEAAADDRTRVMRLECGCGITFDHVQPGDIVRYKVHADGELWRVNYLDHYAAFDTLHLGNNLGVCKVHSYLVEYVGKDTLTTYSTYGLETSYGSWHNDMTSTGPRRYFPNVPSKRDRDPIGGRIDITGSDDRLTLVRGDEYDFDDYEYGHKKPKKKKQKAEDAPKTRPLRSHGISTADLIKDEVQKLEHREKHGHASTPSEKPRSEPSTSAELPKPIPKRDGDW